MRLNPQQTRDAGYVAHYNCVDSIVSNARGLRGEESSSPLLEHFPPGPADSVSLPAVPEADMNGRVQSGSEGQEGAQHHMWEQNARIVWWGQKSVEQNHDPQVSK